MMLLQEDVDRISNWISNNLTQNVKKTKYMLLTRQHPLSVDLVYLNGEYTLQDRETVISPDILWMVLHLTNCLNLNI